MKRKLSFSLALTAVMALNFACNSGPVRAYPGAERPAAELATVSLSPRESNLTIALVDGQEVGSRIHDVHVLPGRHTFLVKVYAHSGLLAAQLSNTQERAVTFEVQAGRAYTIAVKQTGLGSDALSLSVRHDQAGTAVPASFGGRGP
jgi:hypothetical protein